MAERVQTVNLILVNGDDADVEKDEYLQPYDIPISKDGDEEHSDVDDKSKAILWEKVNINIIYTYKLFRYFNKILA